MYTNYKKWSLTFDPETTAFSVSLDGVGNIIADAKISSYVAGNGETAGVEDFYLSSVQRRGAAIIFGGEDYSGIDALYSRKIPDRQPMLLSFSLSDGGFRLSIGGDQTSVVTVTGHLRLGEHPQTETRACRIGFADNCLRCGVGPAATICDNALFDPDTDTAAVFSANGSFTMKYDWDAGMYAFKYTQTSNDFEKFFSFNIMKDVYENVFHMDYKKYNVNTTFKTPPVGWMTWYAVQFHAGEKTVLENTEFQEKYLKKYGADTIWVDWEWYHRNFMGISVPEVNMLSPDPVSYPNGLKYIAEKIEEAGFIPALWVGPTNDPTENDYIKEHPEIVMVKKADWCGLYYMDPTHPEFVNGLLPKMINQCLSWGYKAFKWDCMPHTTQLCDENHDTLYDNTLSTREAMLVAVKKMRELIGENFDLMYCCSLSQRDIDLACTYFDSSRIGCDVFKWEEYINEGIEKLFKYYSLHNTVIRCDPDNVVLREKYNTLDQARSRATITALAGLPYTFGDELGKLPENRVDIIRRTIPPIPGVHPLDIRTCRADRTLMITSLTSEKPFGTRNVFGITNLTDKENRRTVDIERDLHLEKDGSVYLVYDYWNDRFVGRFTDSFNLCLRPHETAALSVVREVMGIPQIISTSRHVSQGILELKNVEWDSVNGVLSGVSEVVGGDPYRLILSGIRENTPPAWHSNDSISTEVAGVAKDVWSVVFHPEESGEFKWSVGFIDTLPV